MDFPKAENCLPDLAQNSLKKGLNIMPEATEIEAKHDIHEILCLLREIACATGVHEWEIIEKDYCGGRMCSRCGKTEMQWIGTIS